FLGLMGKKRGGPEHRAEGRFSQSGVTRREDFVTDLVLFLVLVLSIRGEGERLRSRERSVRERTAYGRHRQFAIGRPGRLPLRDRGEQLQITSVGTVIMASPGSTGNVVAALASFFIPGLGQLLQGKLIRALIM